MRRALIVTAGVLALASSRLIGPARAGSPNACGCGPTSGSGSGGSGSGGAASGGAAGGGSSGGAGGASHGASGAGRAVIYGASWSGASSSTSTSTSVSTTSTGVGAVNAQALLNAQSSGYGSGGGGGGGGGGAWGEGVTTTLEDVHVETPGPAARVCVDWRAEPKVLRLEASCVDDKDVPHPASQVTPQREIADGYEGEVYRCIAGARMRFTLIGGGGEGQTRTCQKGDALVRTAGGALECRPQRPARDCNERSLLRRYGASDKLVRVAQGKVCAAWRDQADPPGPQALN